MKQVGIIGGGASGMMAAVAAAGAGAQVTILEVKDRIGKKILATGNGKCNLSNLDFCVERDYRGHDVKRLKAFFERFGVEETRGFFQDKGLFLTDRNGYLYPRCGQASAVLDFLRSELDFLGVKTVCDCRIQKIVPSRRFTVRTDRETYSFDRLVLACGTKAGAGKKDAADGFELAQSLGLKVYSPLPALTGLRGKDPAFKAMAGVRCAAKVRLRVSDDPKTTFWEEEGELQLTDYGISGIPVFQLSRYASEALFYGKKVRASIDFVPDIPHGEEWKRCCLRQYDRCFGRKVEILGNGLVHKKIVQALMKRCGLKPDDIVSEKTKKRIFEFLELLRDFGTEITEINPVESAQICLGGVALKEVNDQLEALKVPGLYLCGEMLDVDGRCGGYNLQWAWTSGHIAGTAAAAEG